MNKLKIALCTVPNAKTARRLANLWVSRRWAKCVNIVPEILSVYRWQGRVEKSREHLLIVKGGMKGLKKIEKSLDKEHPYDLPEWVVLEASQVAKKYLIWALDENS